MKRLLLILSLTIALNIHAQEQSNYMSNNEIQAFLDTLVANKEELKGKTMEYFYLMFELTKLPLRHFSYDVTSPWIDPEGISYLTSVLLFTEKLSDMDAGKEYFEIKLVLDIPQINAHEYFKPLPHGTYEIWWNAFKQRTMTMPVKDIIYYRVILPLHF